MSKTTLFLRLKASTKYQNRSIATTSIFNRSSLSIINVVSIMTKEIEQSHVINDENVKSETLEVEVLFDKSKQSKKKIKKKKKKKVNLFVLLTRRFNIHQDLHFEDIIYEYATLVNCNIFIEENKHKFFKDIVARTNFINVKETLLIRENVQQTMRFILNKFFENIESVIIAQLRNI